MSAAKITTGISPVNHETPPQLDTRRETRHDTRSVVQIYWKDQAGLPCDGTGVIRNVSARGFGLTADRSFDLGQSITVRTPDRSLECVVRHVRPRTYSFMVGLEIRASSDGSSLEHSLENLSSALGASIPT